MIKKAIVVITLAVLLMAIVSITLFIKFSVNNKEANTTMSPGNINEADATMPPYSIKEVKSEHEAIEIAKSYVLWKYNQSFDDYRIKTLLEDDVWIVYYGIGDPEMDGGGGPEVHINRSNGEILQCFLAQ